MKPFYETSIPSDAKEVVCGKYGDGKPQRIEFRRGKEVVGIRLYDRKGVLDQEYCFRNNLRHGWQYHFYDSGIPSSAEHFEDGLEHGTTYQWSHTGDFIGSYTMERGTGWDIWRGRYEDDEPTVSELRRYVDGKRHGPEWWVNDDQESVRKEEIYWEGLKHGVERRWDWDGNLDSEHPKYWIHGEEVDGHAYNEASVNDPTLPPFRIEDKLPQRTFPLEVAVHLARPEKP